ncbi:hypothetical protein M0R04_12325 [Candidatus Dojkabacteria bacterium]|jgi:hypothetical protein|nr:hypothetical protein [Candidatus Dojkabacteria bacterium]
MKEDFSISELQKIEENKYKTEKLADSILLYQKNVDEINRHIAVLNDDLTRNSLSLAELVGDNKTVHAEIIGSQNTMCERIKTLEKFFWIVISLSAGGLITSVFNLIFK